MASMTSVFFSLAPSPTASTMAQKLDEPALDPPPGVVPHFSTSSYDQRWFYVAAAFCTVVPGVLFAMRLYTRIRIIRKMDVTDCMFFGVNFPNPGALLLMIV
jgi:hypothetical protein